MSRKFQIGLFALLLVCALATQSVYAQETPYVVIGNQPINARQCPRLDCPVVKSLPAGTQINVVGTVTGDTVFGTDQWMQVEDNGVEMFVHSALVKPASESQPAATQTDENSAEVDTSHWIVHETNHFRVLAPRSWVNIADVATDEEFLNDAEEVFGKEERDWYVAMQQAYEEGVFDLVLVDTRSGCLRFSHTDLGTPRMSVRYLKRLAEAYVTDNGGEVVRSDITRFPAGQGFRITAEVPADGIVYSWIVYAVVTEKEVSYFELTFGGSTQADYYVSTLDAIVNSFNRSNLTPASAMNAMKMSLYLRALV